jgi:hypothetical protein
MNSLPDPQRGVSPWRESKRTLALQDQPGNPAKLVFFFYQGNINCWIFICSKMTIDVTDIHMKGAHC